ncbi:MAG: hypothetical protein ACLQVM_27680 [Terriglobia bacterium]
MARPLLPKIAPLRFHLETCGPFRGPEYAGALFRGGFGKFFGDPVCVARMPVCDGCALLYPRPYSIVFGTPATPGQFTGPRKYTRAPHPLVVAPALAAAVTHRASSRPFNWDRVGGRQRPGAGVIPHLIWHAGAGDVAANSLGIDVAGCEDTHEGLRFSEAEADR